jgi:hypothetical protein
MSLAQLRAGYRFKDLKEARIVSSRGDLSRKQRLHGFPRPVKTGDRSAWWGSDVIDAWLLTRSALRDKLADDPERDPINPKHSPVPPKTPSMRETAKTRQGRARKVAVEIADTS